MIYLKFKVFLDSFLFILNRFWRTSEGIFCHWTHLRLRPSGLRATPEDFVPLLWFWCPLQVKTALKGSQTIYIYIWIVRTCETSINEGDQAKFVSAHCFLPSCILQDWHARIGIAIAINSMLCIYIWRALCLCGCAYPVASKVQSAAQPFASAGAGKRRQSELGADEMKCNQRDAATQRCHCNHKNQMDAKFVGSQRKGGNSFGKNVVQCLAAHNVSFK